MVNIKKSMRDLKRTDQNSCFTDCIAFMLKEDTLKVPFFIKHDDFVKRAKRYCLKRGYILIPVRFKEAFLSNKRKYYMVQGISPRSTSMRTDDRRVIHHCVIYRGKVPYFDPAKRQRFLKKPVWLWTFTKI